MDKFAPNLLLPYRFVLMQQPVSDLPPIKELVPTLTLFTAFAKQESQTGIHMLEKSMLNATKSECEEGSFSHVISKTQQNFKLILAFHEPIPIAQAQETQFCHQCSVGKRTLCY